MTVPRELRSRKARPSARDSVRSGKLHKPGGRRWHPLALIVAVVVAIAMYWWLRDRPIRHRHELSQLLRMAADDYRTIDVACLNLACVEGLSGLDMSRSKDLCKSLDQWAQRVRVETKKYRHRLNDLRYSSHYANSEARFQVEMLVQVLQEDFGVHYNIAREREIDFHNPKDLFIHGLIEDSNGGTCASMPVLYVAIARRLGYPVKLVEAKAHLFCRWEAPGETFNFEGSGTQGIAFYDDHYYQSWPRPISQEELNSRQYLISLEPHEEFAAFLALRGHHLIDMGRTGDAVTAYEAAHRLYPRSRDIAAFLNDARTKLAASR